MLDIGEYRGPTAWAIGQERGDAGTRPEVYELEDFPPAQNPSSEGVPTLNSLLAATGKSRHAIAKLLGQTEATIDQWEQDPAQITLSELMQVATLFSLTPTQLIGTIQEELNFKEGR